MTDLSITVAQVLPGSADTDVFVYGLAGATITAGQALYLDSVTSTYKPADANASQATAAVAGIATHGALTGQPIKLQTAGDITLGAGAAPVVSVLYVVSATPGGIAPAADLASGYYTTVLGVGIAGSKLRLRPWSTGQVAA